VAPRRWVELTWEEVRDLEPSRTVALLPAGAIEAHGPHLPLGTDVLIAEVMAEAAAARLEAAGLFPVLLPALPYAAAPFGAAFPGTLSVDGAAVKGLILDLARDLTQRGFLALGIANAHLDPAHLAALAEAAQAAADERLLPVASPDLTQKPWATRLTEEFQSGACHAGRFEGSIVLAVRPDLVKEEVRSGLPAVEASLSRAIRRGARTFEEAGGPRAYFGRPAEATAEEGRRTIETLGAILADAIRERLTAEGQRG
jgi:creatinine amidohydrolase